MGSCVSVRRETVRSCVSVRRETVRSCVSVRRETVGSCVSVRRETEGSCVPQKFVSTALASAAVPRFALQKYTCAINFAALY